MGDIGNKDSYTFMLSVHLLKFGKQEVVREQQTSAKAMTFMHSGEDVVPRLDLKGVNVQFTKPQKA